jgi:hypothetical protein
LEDQARLKEQIDSAYISARSKGSFKKVSTIHVVKVILKLLPIVINLRQDRRKWVKYQGKNTNEEKFRRHANIYWKYSKKYLYYEKVRIKFPITFLTFILSKIHG